MTEKDDNFLSMIRTKSSTSVCVVATGVYATTVFPSSTIVQKERAVIFKRTFFMSLWYDYRPKRQIFLTKEGVNYVEAVSCVVLATSVVNSEEVVSILTVASVMRVVSGITVVSVNILVGSRSVVTHFFIQVNVILSLSLRCFTVILFTETHSGYLAKRILFISSSYIS